MKTTQWIAILDFGSQYSQLIARRVREQRVYSEIVPFDISAADLMKRAPSGIILSGGPASVFDPKAPLCHQDIFNLGIPILGICYGMQMIVRTLGGIVEPACSREFGDTQITITDTTSLFKDMPDRLQVWMSHGDHVDRMPDGFHVLAKTTACPVAAIADNERNIYGLQFHPEVAHTPQGTDIIRRFVFDVCACDGDWEMSRFIKDAKAKIKRQTGTEHVVCGLSGGVDSAVTAVLLQQAIGDQLHCIFVDNGLLRSGEIEAVEKTLVNSFGIDLIVVDARKLFLDQLKGVVDPEEKRKRIGKTFIDVFAAESLKLGNIKYLAQGTLYTDVIESVSPIGGPSVTIKSHHNVGGLPANLQFELLEPVRELFKDEVRVLGRELGIPDAIIDRQPFPGPGLAVRILGEVTDERLELLRQADIRVQEEIAAMDNAADIWQSFAVLLPIQTVGVMGDSRTYENVAALRVVGSRDGMTADWVRLPYDTLARISNRIINEVAGINRVVYDISSKPPATIEWE